MSGLRLIEQLHPREGWGVLLLTLGLTIVTSAAIADSGWTSQLSVIPAVGMGAFVVGLMIARSRLPALLGHPFSLIIGFAWSFRMVTTLLPNHYQWLERWEWVWWRLYQWASKVAAGSASDDNLVFTLQMAFLTWVVTYVVVWYVFRSHKVWHAIIVGGTLFLVVLYYAPNELAIYFSFYLVLVMLLVIRFNLFAQERVWRREQVHFNAGEVAFDFWRAGALFSVLIVALAWLAPPIAVAGRFEAFDSVRGPLYDLEAQWSRLFTSLNYRASPGADFSGKTLTLGGARRLEDGPVLEVKAPPELRYWRMVTFDTFTGREWQNSDETVVRFGADFDALTLLGYQAREPVTHTVTALVQNTSVLAMAGQPTWVSRPARATLSYVDTASGEGMAQVDTISYARSRIPFDAGDQYLVSTLVTQASVEQLRQAGEDYPLWVTGRYIQLPDSVSGRVEELAQQIGAPHYTVYDKATAIERYLRREIEYQEAIDAPPNDRDPVEYMLFESREGYCDYYATAMAVMLRSLGIPARIASGYSQGEYRFEKEAYVVLEKNAHSWVEVFFPGYGWIEFEPTAAEPGIERPTGLETTSGLEETAGAGMDAGLDGAERPRDLDRLEDQPLGGGGGWNLPPWIRLFLNNAAACLWIGLLLVVLAGVVTWWVRERRYARLSQVEAVYQRMLQLAGWAGASPHAWHTPYENALALARIVPAGRAWAWAIADLYTRERYGTQTPTAEETAHVKEAWRRLRLDVGRAVLRRLVFSLIARLPVPSSLAQKP